MSGTITVLAEGVKFVGRVMLEGAYAGGGAMSTAQSAVVPLTQPYSVAMFDGTPLNYDGSESVVALPAGTVDWILVDLRTATGAETSVEGALQAAFLLNDGLIVGLDGDTLVFEDVDQTPYHVVVRHRNHTSVMTADSVPGFAAGLGVWDFTTSAGQAFTAGGTPQKMLESEVFGMFAADADADGFVTAPDFNTWNASTTSGAEGYEAADFNLDTYVTAPDFNLWNANTTAGAASRVPD